MEPTVIYPSTKPLIALACVEAVLIAGIVALCLFQGLSPVYVLVPVLAATGLLMGAMAMRARSRRMTIGPHQLSLETGLLAKDQRAFDLSKIQDVRSEQSVFERLTGTGTVIVQTASHDGGIRMEGIDQPKAVVAKILDAQRQHSKGMSK
jgi:membrane protein YdbS with pleckstrin-like domain